MDQQTPWQPGQHSDSGNPPETPPSGPYAPPSGAYTPPPGDPYMPPQQPAPGGYEPQGYGQPPVKKGGFNWLACCGISCGVLLLIGIIAGVFMYKSCSGLVGMGMQMQAQQTAVQSTDIATIKSSAASISVEQLNADPNANKGEWVALEGVLGVDSAGMGQSMSSSGGQQVPSTNYFIEPNIVIMDLSVAPSVANPGDTVRAYGKYTVMDLRDIPFVGKMIEEEMAKDPSVMGGKTQLVMFTAKEVELVSSVAGETPMDGGGDAAGGADWSGK